MAAACVPQESHLAVAAYSSPHIQSKRFTGSPPFQTGHQKPEALPSRHPLITQGSPGSYSRKRLSGNGMRHMIRPGPANVDRERSRPNDGIFLRVQFPCHAPLVAKVRHRCFSTSSSWRCDGGHLSLAADLDRIERAAGGKELVASDPRLAQAAQAVKTLLHERVRTGRESSDDLLRHDAPAPEI